MRTKLQRKMTTMILMALMGPGSSIAQTLNKPTPADNPNQAGNSIWSAACATVGFNDYFVDFTWSTPLVNSNNVFLLELSDANGSFNNPVELARDNTKNTVFNFSFNFSLPTDTRGEGYKMRVRSTSPAITGSASDAFPMYFIAFNSPLLISANGDGNIPSGGTIQVCDGNSVTLRPHNIPNADTYRYNWYRSGTQLTEKGASLTISQAGIYNVELDYGTICSGSANTLSNDITISAGNNLGIAINPPTTTTLCPGESTALVSNISGQGLSYTWYQNGTAITIPTVNNDTFTVNASLAGFEGDYQVEISGPGTCLERSTAVNITNAGNFTVTRENTETVILLPGENKILSVSSSTPSVSYQWYRDGISISGATANTLTVTQTGTYHAEATLTGGACTSTSRNSDPTTVVAPTSLQVVIGYNGSYADCNNTDVVLEARTINAIMADNSSRDVTVELLGAVNYQWFKNGNNLAGATSRTISLASLSENGSYTLEATISTYNATSNTLPVQLRVNESLAIASSGLTTCNTSEPITITTTTDLNGQTFEWLFNGNVINSTNAELSTTQPGRYQLVLFRNGCPLTSNEAVIAPLDESLITLDPPDNVVFPEGNSRTVNASGGTAYQWFDANNVLLSSTSSLTLIEEGTYQLVATIDNCEITKQITATFLDTFKVPNVITVNGDGLNDQWVIPNSYARNENIRVLIFNDRGEEVFNQTSYQNNWPQSTTSFPKQNMVFFYKIRSTTEVLKQGTITVIR